MRFATLAFCVPAIAGAGWKIGTWCGTGITDYLDHYIEKSVREKLKKQELADSQEKHSI